MSCGNPFKHAIEDVKETFSKSCGVPMQGNEMSDLVANYKPKYADDVMECLQFGICSSKPVPPREVPYFHF